MKFEDLRLGMTDSVTKRFTEQDVIAFAELSTDKNPLHLDEEVAKKVCSDKE